MDKSLNTRTGRVWIYCRVAREDEMSLRAQKNSLVKFAKQQG